MMTTLRTNRKKIFTNTGLILLLAVGFTLLFTAIGLIGKAHAGPPGGSVVSPDDPGGLAMQIYQFMHDGHNIMAVGAGLMLLTYGLRFGATKLPAPLGPWFGGMLGGYVLGFGTAALAYVGPALVAGEGLSFGLFAQAIGTGFAASGKWEGLRDLWGKLHNGGAQPTMGIVKKSAVVGLLLVIVVASCSGCPGPTPKPVQDIVDCSKTNSPEVIAMATECAAKPTWSEKEACVVAALPKLGWDVGGCVLADLVQQYLTTKGAAQNAPQSHEAHDALEDYRAKYGHGATFHTKDGNL